MSSVDVAYAFMISVPILTVTYLLMYLVLWYFKVSARNKLPMIRDELASIVFTITSVINLLVTIGEYVLRNGQQHFPYFVWVTVAYAVMWCSPFLISYLMRIRENLPER